MSALPNCIIKVVNNGYVIKTTSPDGRNREYVCKGFDDIERWFEKHLSKPGHNKIPYKCPNKLPNNYIEDSFPWVPSEINPHYPSVDGVFPSIDKDGFYTSAGLHGPRLRGGPDDELLDEFTHNKT